MIVTVTPAMQRKAEALAVLVPTLPRGRDKRTGIGYVTFPSSIDPLHTGHNTNGLGCTCQGNRRRGTCTHALAVSLVHQRAEAAAITAAQAPARSAQERFEAAGPFGPCCHKGCAEAATGKNRRCDAHFAALLVQLGI